MDEIQTVPPPPPSHRPPASATAVLAEELPSVLWGLDPVFSAFPRLYVRDIQDMPESIQVPGIYFYNSHPVYRVDVLGKVVYKREREDFFCYGVDDGTGVINCLCWKNELLKGGEDPHTPAGKHHVADYGGFNPVSEMEKLRRAQHNRCRLEIGELLRVRGLVKTSRDKQREILASSYYKVNDPVMSVQIAWMMEVPELYRQCYDKPLQLPQGATGNSTSTALNKAKGIILDFCEEKSVNRFRPYDLQNILQPLVSSQLQTTAADQPVAGPSACQQLCQLLKEALDTLEKEGFIYRKVKSQDQVYNVTTQDKDLLIAVKCIIREDSAKDKYAVKGCHILHILSAVRQRYSLNVSRAALERLLSFLECSSDIISTGENRYTVF
ncbi:CST complex subunit STN1 isoform X2 [Cynoglossus semilaevis]|uniref:CST complex subunit STN1 isoform X2 n=1 Tax=Cynoglossus semilaevis TaxID=244447 RepID=UPI000494F0FE|nr:CST complex subunit STN1 isoform X2 [Cynoglossus semilaevis]